MIPSRFVFSQKFQILMFHGTFEKNVIKVQKSVRYHSHFRLKTCPKIRKGILPMPSCPTPGAALAPLRKWNRPLWFLFLPSTTTLDDHVCQATASKWLLAHGISDPVSPPPRLQLFLCPLPLKVSASCGGGHSKWAYISYWDLGRIHPNLNWAQINQLQGFRQTYCDNRSHYLKLLCHCYFMNLCRVCARVQLRIVLLPHSIHKVLHGTTIII